MKKIISKASVLLFVSMFSTVGYINAQELTKFKEDDSSYFKMIENTTHEIDNVLLKSKPSEINLSEYRINLIAGKMPLSEEYQNKILEITNPLAEYGYELAKMNNIEIDIDDISSKLAFATLNLRTFGFRIPGITVNENLTWGEVGTCALGALGVDAAWALGGSNATVWTMSSIRTAFTAVAKRFLGSIGVALAVGSFSFCLLVEAQDYQQPFDGTKPDFRNTPIQLDANLNFITIEP